MQNFIFESKPEIERLCMKYDVKTMYFFGSVCSDRFNDKSDIDILISFKEIPIDRYTDNFFKLHEELEGLFRRKIDLLTEASIINPFLRDSIYESRELLYAA
ncbi:MAG: nucleotidyltransferase domain-containing protein [Desulfuromusa sp.]|nr:nucleotidyltransferase domain-containing protein [Desulfuromusa sp.]